MADTGFPPGVAEKIAAMGPNFNPEILEATKNLYLPLIKNQSTPKSKTIADIPYGTDPRQRLDLYRPEGSRLPMLIYIPGGGFVGGDKNMDGTFYTNLGNYFANHGLLMIVANYRLAPTHVWPAGAEDVGSVVAWARTHAEANAGDANRVFLWGQSAGASHLAGYLFDTSFHLKGGPGVTAAILMSGVYQIAAGNLAPNLRAYYGDDERQYEARSPLTHVNKSRVPLLLSAAQFDPPWLAAPSFELARAVTLRDGRSPHFVWQEGHNHVSTVMSIGSGQDDVGERVLRFLKSF